MEKKSVAQRSLEAIQKALNSVHGEVTLDDFYSITFTAESTTLQGHYKAEIVVAMRQLVNNFSTNDSGYLVGGYYLTLPIEEPNIDGHQSVYVKVILT